MVLNLFFYIRVVEGWSESYTKSFLDKVVKFNKSYKPDAKNNWNGNYVSLERERFKNFYGFNYDPERKKIMEYSFIKIDFDTYGDMRKCIAGITSFYNYNKENIENGKICFSFRNGEPRLDSVDRKDKKWFKQEHNCDCESNLYESKLHPMLRFIHLKGIKSCGWVL